MSTPVYDHDADKPVTDPVIVAIYKELEDSRVAISHGAVGEQYRLELARRLRKHMYYPEPRGSNEYGLLGRIELEGEQLSALGKIVNAIEEHGGVWSFSKGVLNIRMEVPTKLGSGPHGTHEFARGWIMGRGVAKVDDALEEVGLPRVAWEAVEHTRGKISKRYAGVVRS